MCFFPVTMTPSLTSSEGRVRPKSVLASADATLTLREGARVVTVLRSVGGKAAEMGAGFFFSGQGRCELCLQFVVQMSRYVLAFGSRSLDNWHPGSVLMVERKGGGQSDGDR